MLLLGVMLLLGFASAALPLVFPGSERRLEQDVWLARQRMKRLQRALQDHRSHFGVYPPDADSLRHYMQRDPGRYIPSSAYGRLSGDSDATATAFADPQADSSFVVVIDSLATHYQIRSSSAGYISSWTDPYQFDRPSWE